MPRTDLFPFGAVLYEMGDRSVAVPGRDVGFDFRRHPESGAPVPVLRLNAKYTRPPG